MGRRSLGKIDPNLDLSRHLLTLADVACPLKLEEIFPNSQPLEIEVGSGKGLFIATASGDQPERDFLGIEIAKKYARFAASKLARNERENAVMLSGDAERLFADHLADGVATAVHVYFPDPWWKKRHRKRRIMNEGFLRQAHRVLKADGLLHFWTDVHEYFEVACELIDELGCYVDPVTPQVDDPEHDLDYRTHFERRMRKAKEPVYRVQYTKG